MLLRPTDGPEMSNGKGAGLSPEGLLADAEFRHLQRDLRCLTRPDQGRWIEAIEHLIDELQQIRVNLEALESQKDAGGGHA